MGVFTARIAMVAFLAMAPAASALGGAEEGDARTTYGAWETWRAEGLTVAQTRTPTMSLHVACPKGAPEAMSATLIMDVGIPAYRSLRGPVASFDFDEKERIQFAAIHDASAKQPERVLRIEAGREALQELIGKLKRARKVGVVVIGGKSFAEARLARAELSLKGSSKALNALRRGCR